MNKNAKNETSTQVSSRTSLGQFDSGSIKVRPDRAWGSVFLAVVMGFAMGRGAWAGPGKGADSRGEQGAVTAPPVQGAPQDKEDKPKTKLHPVFPTKSGKAAALKEHAKRERERDGKKEHDKPGPQSQGLLQWWDNLADLLAPNLANATLPSSDTDEKVVPHYFGPYPNWALSPMTLPDVEVVIDGHGFGTGATATATIGANGKVTGVTVTDPGSNYTGATTVSIRRSSNHGFPPQPAQATASVVTVGPIISIDLIANNPGPINNPDPTLGSGGGYVSPRVVITDTLGGSGQGADATVYGGVDAVQLTNPGTSYKFPTVEFDLPDWTNGVKATGHAVCDEGVTVAPYGCDETHGILRIAVDTRGSGYSFAPQVTIRDGTPDSPSNSGSGATATATLALYNTVINDTGSNYSNPVIAIEDAGGAGTGAEAYATVKRGAINGITVTDGGSGYITQGGIEKFVDTLPKLCAPSGDCTSAKNNLGQYIPLGVPDTVTYPKIGNAGDSNYVPAADYYQIALVQHRECLNSTVPGCRSTDIPKRGTLLREYVQLETPANASWSKHVPLLNDNVDPTKPSTPVLIDGKQAYGVDDPHYLGPVLAASKNRPIRVTFYNLLPTGAGGDLIIPTDSTIMGAGYGPLQWPTHTDQGLVTDAIRNPECTQYPKSDNCFKDNRATLHLHGALSPWISDGTPHQWITPAGETTPWPQGDSVLEVPDMITAATGAGSSGVTVPNCSGKTDGCMSFYYTNQQSARMMFYHDHASATTRLNVYLGEAAGYLIRDNTEATLINNRLIPGLTAGDEIPLVIQDRTFVPETVQLSEQDPTWDATRWGGAGNFWFHHVYMPAQNPGDPSGLSAYGRWMYGPWFWPPATPQYSTINNPYFGKDPKSVPAWQPLATPCNLDVPSTWQYDTDPFCEPEQIPGTPNISTGMEQFNDTPLVNGTAYPTTTLQPKTYRFRILNASNDRFLNLQWYVGDAATASSTVGANGVVGATEVALKPEEVAAAQVDPFVFPTPVDSSTATTASTKAPDWIQIGTEGGFLPAPVVVDGQQPTTWITDVTRFDVGNVDKHSLVLGPAERADVIVDFSRFKGKTLILYNDAPAAYPARVPSYDYYLGAPDLSPNSPPVILPGYGPNTRTVMQVKIADSTPANAFNLNALNAAFRHNASNTGVFEAGQHPIIVGQAAYNSAYGTTFAASGYCNGPGSTSQVCDGMARISDGARAVTASDPNADKFGFNTLPSLNNPTGSKILVKVEPKGMHDEMNSAAFDEFGRMTANLGVEVVPSTPVAQNIVLYPYINPPSEIINGTNLPKVNLAPGAPEITPISRGDDGTQIWKITHNGVDTHPIHFHLYDVQVLNRVTWDGILLPPEETELGWKDTVRISPLEDTIVALRPVVPQLPFELPNSVRLLNPAMPAGSTLGFNSIDVNGIGTAAITNQLVNFGWEYVWHCHILTHEEMDMMHPQSLALAPKAPTGLVGEKQSSGNVNFSWMDNSITETSYEVQRAPKGTQNWSSIKTVTYPIGTQNSPSTGPQSAVDRPLTQLYDYRIAEKNTVGYGGAYKSVAAQSTSQTMSMLADPTDLVAVGSSGPNKYVLTWKDNASDETGYEIERSTDQITSTVIGTTGSFNGTGTYTDTTVANLTTKYWYRVRAISPSYKSGYATVGAVSVTPPSAPTGISYLVTKNSDYPTTRESVRATWSASATATGYTVKWGTTCNSCTTPSGSAGSGSTNSTTLTYTTSSYLAQQNWYFQVCANNAAGSACSTPQLVPKP